ncbi:MAG: hypothetical protein KGJ13_04630 [Patescibacteria group bacterium]|nr:hypothetical protein [Patescibacteria group bacterium]
MATNSLTATGLTIEAQTDIINDLNTGFINIYGSDINLESNTPDGQIINILSTAIEDQLQLLQTAYNSFSIQNAFGVQVDNLVALNGMQRQGATYTVAQVAVTATQAINLNGLDALVSNPNAQVFTISDVSGNQYFLQTSYSFSGAGTNTLAFRAVNIGAILTTANTITVIITPTIGITSVNNPSTAGDIIGVDEETDIQLKVRQGKSFKMAATGPADSIRAQLLNTPGISDAYVPDNDTDSIVNGVFGHGIAVVVNNSSATAAQIAQVIYTKKPAGTNQTGAFSTIGTISNGTATVTAIPSTSNMATGQTISGAGIPANTTISSVDSATQVTMSANATASAAGETITITPVGTLNTYTITRPAGNTFTAAWFSALPETLYISFTIQAINHVDTFDTTALAASLAAALSYKLNQAASVGDVITAMLQIAPNGYLTSIAVSNTSGGTTQQVSPSDFQHYFTVAAANITITT